MSLSQNSSEQYQPSEMRQQLLSSYDAIEAPPGWDTMVNDCIKWTYFFRINGDFNYPLYLKNYCLNIKNGKTIEGRRYGTPLSYPDLLVHVSIYIRLLELKATDQQLEPLVALLFTEDKGSKDEENKEARRSTRKQYPIRRFVV